MSPARFDLLYSGALVPGTDPQEARQRLQALFRLTDEVSSRLFSGEPVAVKRSVDEDTAARYRDCFRTVGALLQVVPIDNPEGSAEPGPMAALPADRDEVGDDAPHFSLAPPGALLGEVRRFTAARAPMPDLSHLSLVGGDNWTLTDCAPPRATPPPPDTRHLTVERIEPRPAADDDEPII